MNLRQLLSTTTTTLPMNAARPLRFWSRVFPSLLLVALLSLQTVSGGVTNTNTAWSNLRQAVVANYAAGVFVSYQDAIVATKQLQAATETLLTKPSGTSLAAARAAWLTARSAYSQTEAFRFYDGPIDQVESLVNSWPIDENYIDYVAENLEAGVINSVSNAPVLSRELILSLNEKEGKKNISAGFHAIEFLLWGQDLSPTGPGNRPWQDYADGTKNADRRRQYLRLVTGLLLENLETVAADWAADKPGNYRARFVAGNPDAALAKILKGIGALSGPELAGERLTTPYETKEQEEEQDCFSDNTRNDLVQDAVGIQNVYLGHYPGVNGQPIQGPGLHELLLQVDPDFAGKLAAQMQTAVDCARNIPQPFDQAILGTSIAPGRVAIKNAINAFQTQSDMIAKAARMLSIKLNL